MGKPSLKTGEPLQDTDPCQYHYPDLARITTADKRVALRLRRYWWNLKRWVWSMALIGPPRFVSRMLESRLLNQAHTKEHKPNPAMTQASGLNLKPGDWVEVRSEKEIFNTLDAQGKLRGLRFVAEMSKFCGIRFKVYKRLSKIVLEATGERRNIKSPTVLLEGAICDGCKHGGCDRSCFCFWREEWLKKLPLAKAQDIAD